MKRTSKFLPFLVLLTATVLCACKGDDGESKTVEQQQLEKLVGGWTLESAADESADRTNDFGSIGTDRLALQVSGNYTGEGKTYNYSLTGLRPSPSPWPESGTWKFGTNKNTEIIRDPGTPSEIAMSYTVTESKLTLTFTVPDGGGWEGGRVKNVIGDWTFVFTR